MKRRKRSKRGSVATGEAPPAHYEKPLMRYTAPVRAESTGDHNNNNNNNNNNNINCQLPAMTGRVARRRVAATLRISSKQDLKLNKMNAETN